jgi:hypothetical protein
MRRIFCALMLISGALSAGACVPPPGPMERLTDSAYDLNTATRFGRMDVAVAHVANHAQEDFMQRHRDWGRDTRIVDVELNGLQMITPDTAVVNLAVSWHKLSASEMETTFLSQKWTSTGDGWKLMVELRSGGSPGLFTAPKEDEKKKGDDAPNVHTGQL